jgi:hypothetical protein
MTTLIYVKPHALSRTGLGHWPLLDLCQFCSSIFTCAVEIIRVPKLPVPMSPCGTSRRFRPAIPESYLSAPTFAC